MSANQASESSENTSAQSGNGSIPTNDQIKQIRESLEADPTNRKLNRHYTKALLLVNRFDDALECWHRVEDLQPEDPEPAKMIAKLIIMRSRYRAVHGEPPKAESAKKRKPVIEKDFDQVDTSSLYRKNKKSKNDKPKRRKIELTSWQKLEREIAQNPVNHKLYLELADIYLENERDHDADKLLTKALETTDDHPLVREKWEDVKILRSEKMVELAQRRVSVENTPAAKQELAEVQQDHEKFVTDVHSRRLNKDPEDTAVRFQLGLQLKKMGKYEEAHPHFQSALEDPQYKAVAHLELGESLQRGQKFTESLYCYQQSAEFAAEMGEQECQKLALYRVGILATAMKKTDEAKKAYSDLVEIDPEYRDAAKRLNEI